MPSRCKCFEKLAAISKLPKPNPDLAEVIYEKHKQHQAHIVSSQQRHPQFSSGDVLTSTIIFFYRNDDLKCTVVEFHISPINTHGLLNLVCLDKGFPILNFVSSLATTLTIVVATKKTILLPKSLKMLPLKK